MSLAMNGRRVFFSFLHFLLQSVSVTVVTVVPSHFLHSNAVRTSSVELAGWPSVLVKSDDLSNQSMVFQVFLDWGKGTDVVRTRCIFLVFSFLFFFFLLQPSVPPPDTFPRAVRPQARRPAVGGRRRARSGLPHTNLRFPYPQQVGQRFQSGRARRRETLFSASVRTPTQQRHVVPNAGAKQRATNTECCKGGHFYLLHSFLSAHLRQSDHLAPFCCTVLRHTHTHTYTDCFS